MSWFNIKFSKTTQKQFQMHSIHTVSFLVLKSSMGLEAERLNIFLGWVSRDPLSCDSYPRCIFSVFGDPPLQTNLNLEGDSCTTHVTLVWLGSRSKSNFLSMIRVALTYPLRILVGLLMGVRGTSGCFLMIKSSNFNLNFKMFFLLFRSSSVRFFFSSFNFIYLS